MTRKDYVLIAKVLNDFQTDENIPVDDRNAIAYDLADAFQAENPNFDRRRFLVACGTWDAMVLEAK